MNWYRLAPTSHFPLREGRSVQLGPHELAVFNLGAKFLAVTNRCPHRGGPLADGIVSGDRVVCPLHAWKVCLHSGNVDSKGEENAAGCIPTFPVRVEDGVVMVQLPAA